MQAQKTTRIDEYLTIPEAMQIAKITRPTFDKLVRAGVLPPKVYLSPRIVRVNRAAFLAALRGQEPAPQ